MITSVVITKTGGASTKIGIGDIHVTIAPSDVQLGFDVALTDGDDDPVNASFVVDIDANNDGNYDAAVNALSVISPESTEFSAFASLFDQDQMLRHDNYDLI